ncbi:MAG: hypothetical protein ACO1NN_00090 [Sphingopyxis sp.]
MVDLISSISSALDIVKKLRELDKKIGEADFKMLLADLTSELGDAKLEAANLKIDLAEAKGKIDELEREASRKSSAEPEIHDNAYVFGDNGRHYCTGCYDKRGEKILLNEQPRDFQVFGKWMCPSCKNTYGGSI